MVSRTARATSGPDELHIHESKRRMDIVMKYTRMLSLTAVWLTLASGHAQAQGGTWTTKAPMPQPRYFAGGAIVGGRMYLLGGYDATGSSDPRPETYDSLTDTWIFGAPASIHRSEVAAGVLNNKIYVAGGFVNSDSNTGTGALEIYDPATDSWASGAPMPISGIGNAASAAIGGKLYIAGGTHGYWQSPAFPNLEIYDPMSDTWSAGAPLPLAVTEAGGAAIGGKFYVIGGHFGFNGYTLLGITGALQIYDPVLNTWSTGAPMPTPRFQAVVGGIDGRLIVVADTTGLTKWRTLTSMTLF